MWDTASLVFILWYLVLSSCFYLFDTGLVRSDKYYSKSIGDRATHLDLKSILPTVCSNLILAYVTGKVVWGMVGSWKSPISEWPSVIHLIITVVIEEVWFYHSHRVMHCSFMYKFHKQHHSFNKPIALAALYCHPVEMLLCNIPLVLVGPIITSMSLTTYVIWNLITATYVCLNHCGHQLIPTWIVDTTYHDLHHQQTFRFIYSRLFLRHVMNIIYFNGSIC
jgi:sterol desaturase/sphingolipid hydroxylase (fatty acid hydroxylase superfamily)